MRFITFEGMDGAGKTTTSASVARLVARDGNEVLYVDKKKIALDHPYLAQHAETLRNLIWSYPPTAPIQGLGDPHWLHLMASWFYLLDETVIRPALAAGGIVIVDSWIGKFLARFALKDGLRGEQAKRAFADLSQPDFTLFLDVDPTVAAGRKREFTIAECGNLDGYVGTSAENFVNYQTCIRRALLDLAAAQGWHAINTTEQSEAEVVIAAARAIAVHLGAAAR